MKIGNFFKFNNKIGWCNFYKEIDKEHSEFLKTIPEHTIIPDNCKGFNINRKNPTIIFGSNNPSFLVVAQNTRVNSIFKNCNQISTDNNVEQIFFSKEIPYCWESADNVTPIEYELYNNNKLDVQKIIKDPCSNQILVFADQAIFTQNSDLSGEVYPVLAEKIDDKGKGEMN